MKEEKNMKSKILFITCNNYNDTSYGGGQCSNRNFIALRKLGEVIPYHIKRKSSLRSLMTIAKGYFPPTEKRDLLNIKRLIKQKEIDVIFFDGSIFGKLLNKIKAIYPKMKVITFFHNVEVDYIDVRFGNGKRSRKNIYRQLVKQSELTAVRESDKLIVLNTRDKNRIIELYGRNPDKIIPITFEDKYHSLKSEENHSSDDQYCLLVGSMKRDMYEGVEWFVNMVAPLLPIRTVIVGKGFEKKRDVLARPQVQVIGTVDDLSKYYVGASLIAIPILSGAGMKVKTAEALMYGKTIFGTTEAFEGYNLDYDKVGGLCNTSEEFIKNICAYLECNPTSKYNDYSRSVFQQNFSTVASDKLYKIVFEDVAKY